METKEIKNEEIKSFKQSNPISYKELIKYIKNCSQGNMSRSYDDTEAISFSSIDIFTYGKLIIDGLKIHEFPATYSKFEINRKNNIIKVWKSNGKKENPDILIKNVFNDLN